MSGEINLLLRHEERVFGPVSVGQVHELLEAGTITDTDSVREETGPWVLIRDYLEWKEADAASVADISELLGKAAPKPAAKPAQEPTPAPDPALGETREMETPWRPRPGSGTSAGGRSERPKSSGEPTTPASGDVVPLAASPSSPSRPDDAARRSRGTLDNIALPEDTDLDAVLRAMVAYEQTAPPLKPRRK